MSDVTTIQQGAECPVQRQPSMRVQVYPSFVHSPNPTQTATHDDQDRRHCPASAIGDCTWRAWISAIFCLRRCALPRRCSAMCSALVVVMLHSAHTCGPAPHSTFRWCRLPAR